MIPLVTVRHFRFNTLALLLIFLFLFLSHNALYQVLNDHRAICSDNVAGSHLFSIIVGDLKFTAGDSEACAICCRLWILNTNKNALSTSHNISIGVNAPLCYKVELFQAEQAIIRFLASFLNSGYSSFSCICQATSY